MTRQTEKDPDSTEEIDREKTVLRSSVQGGNIQKTGERKAAAYMSFFGLIDPGRQ